MRRVTVRFASLFLVLGFVSPGAAISQEWPTRPIQIVVPQSAGSALDIVTRVVAEELLHG